MYQGGAGGEDPRGSSVACCGSERATHESSPARSTLGSDKRRYVNRVTRGAPGCRVGRQGGNSGNLLTRQVRPRGLIGRATAGRLRHVPAGATAAGYFAAFFLRSAQ